MAEVKTSSLLSKWQCLLLLRLYKELLDLMLELAMEILVQIPTFKVAQQVSANLTSLHLIQVLSSQVSLLIHMELLTLTSSPPLLVLSHLPRASLFLLK